MVKVNSLFDASLFRLIGGMRFGLEPQFFKHVNYLAICLCFIASNEHQTTKFKFKLNNSANLK